MTRNGLIGVWGTSIAIRNTGYDRCVVLVQDKPEEIHSHYNVFDSLRFSLLASPFNVCSKYGQNMIVRFKQSFIVVMYLMNSSRRLSEIGPRTHKTNTTLLDRVSFSLTRDIVVWFLFRDLAIQRFLFGIPTRKRILCTWISFFLNRRSNTHENGVCSPN